jgi:hypothetical protein
MLLLYPSGDIPEPDNSGRFGRFTFKPKCDEGREFSRYSVVRLRREASKEERFGHAAHPQVNMGKYTVFKTLSGHPQLHLE